MLSTGGNLLTRSLTPDPEDNGTILEPQHDGLTCTPFKEGILVLGGENMRKVWRFSFRSLEWSCISIQGQFAPQKRLNHSTAVWGSNLLVSGGTTEEAEEYLAVYRLDLTSMRWSKLGTSVGVSTREEGYPHMTVPPLSRTHHASCVIGDRLYIHGGRPIYDNMSSYDMRQLQGSGFFEVIELDLNNNQWYPLCHAHPSEYVPPPPLWGHSMVPLADKALLIFGGFEVDLCSRCESTSYPSWDAFRWQLLGEGVEDDDAAPWMEMSNTVHVMGVKTAKWASFAPSVMDPFPEARALHVALMVNANEMLVLGGIGVSASSEVGAEVTPLSSAWVWRVDTGAWRELSPFPVADGGEGAMQGARLFSAVYNNQLVVSNDIVAWNVLDVSTPIQVPSVDGSDTEVYHCTASGIDDWQLVLSNAPKHSHNPLLQSGLVELGSVLHPRRRRMLADESPMRREKGPVDPKRADVVRLYDPFREGNSRPREGQVNPILYALISER